MTSRNSLGLLSFIVALIVGVFLACGSGDGDGADVPTEGGLFGEAAIDGGTQAPGRDPVTCEEAAQFKTYVGCDYWPTVTANLVSETFDFAVAVSNVGNEAANVTVTGRNGVDKKLRVEGGQLAKVFLPWVTTLKGYSIFSIGIRWSVYEPGSAYHLVSDKPVVVYQFSPLEYRTIGGPPGKDWGECGKTPDDPRCASFSNDASLLIPSTAMTGTYRIMGSPGFSRHRATDDAGPLDRRGELMHIAPPFFAVTGTANGTKVEVKLGPKGAVLAADGGISATPAGGTLAFTLNAGDVAEVAGGIGADYDLSGSLLKADKPVQVITGVAAMEFPFDVGTADHIEETLFPAETLGKHYVVPTPTGPRNNKVPHVVRFFGNSDDTKLTYQPSKPPSCPTTLKAGEVAQCGETVATDFEVTGNKEFGVAMFQIGGLRADPTFDPSKPIVANPLGDPSQSFAVTVEQYRKHYLFLAPLDYAASFVDVIAKSGTTVVLDGKNVSSQLKEIAGTGFVLGRLALDNGKEGAHVLDGSEPVGIQVIGYGGATSYQYPGGLNLSAISAPPVR